MCAKLFVHFDKGLFDFRSNTSVTCLAFFDFRGKNIINFGHTCRKLISNFIIMCRRVIGELVSDDIDQETVKSSKICHKALFCKTSADIFSE